MQYFIKKVTKKNIHTLRGYMGPLMVIFWMKNINKVITFQV